MVIPLAPPKVEQGRKGDIERVESRQSGERNGNRIHPDSCQDNAQANRGRYQG